jgi:hypothetical protein
MFRGDFRLIDLIMRKSSLEIARLLVDSGTDVNVTNTSSIDFTHSTDALRLDVTMLWQLTVTPSRARRRIAFTCPILHRTHARQRRTRTHRQNDAASPSPVPSPPSHARKTTPRARTHTHRQSEAEQPCIVFTHPKPPSHAHTGR